MDGGQAVRQWTRGHCAMDIGRWATGTTSYPRTMGLGWRRGVTILVRTGLGIGGVGVFDSCAYFLFVCLFLPLSLLDDGWDFRFGVLDRVELGWVGLGWGRVAYLTYDYEVYEHTLWFYRSFPFLAMFLAWGGPSMGRTRGWVVACVRIERLVGEGCVGWVSGVLLRVA